jgi:hypothetical protein
MSQETILVTGAARRRRLDRARGHHHPAVPVAREARLDASPPSTVGRTHEKTGAGSPYRRPPPIRPACSVSVLGVKR